MTKALAEAKVSRATSFRVGWPEAEHRLGILISDLMSFRRFVNSLAGPVSSRENPAAVLPSQMAVVCNVRLKISGFDDTRRKRKLAHGSRELTISCLPFGAGQRLNAAVTNGDDAVGGAAVVGGGTARDDQRQQDYPQ